MDSNKVKFTSIDEYIATFPEEVQTILEKIRTTIKAAAPDAQEKISYQMPAFAYKGNLVYFAAWKEHIGFYPGSTDATKDLQDELAEYEQSKGAIRFPYDKSIPYELIGKITTYRVAQNIEKAEQKVKKKK